MPTKPFWTSPNGLYQILFAQTYQGWRVRVDNKQMATCDWPIQYESGRIAYDHPEWFPQYVKAKVYAAFRALKETT